MQGVAIVAEFVRGAILVMMSLTVITAGVFVVFYG